jgi:hypothetical protein
MLLLLLLLLLPLLLIILLPLRFPLRKNGFACFWVHCSDGVVANGFFGMPHMHVIRDIILTRF